MVKLMGKTPELLVIRNLITNHQSLYQDLINIEVGIVSILM